jgi:hypothetical protein
MTRFIALGLCGWLLTACGTTGPGRPIARPETTQARDSTRAQAPAPAKSPEMDPANVERRFGTAEARERKQESKRKQQDQQKRVDVDPPEKKTTP